MPVDDKPRRLPASALAFLALTALAIRLWRLDRFSYWLDEILQSFFIHGTWSQFWASLRFDAAHPPLDYLLDRAFDLALDPSDAVRKVLPALWGSGAVAAMAALMTRRAGRTAGALAGLFLALAPFHVRFSQELRPYSLGLFLLLLALLALDVYLEHPGLGRLTGLYGACLATAYALYTAAFVLALAGAALLVDDATSGAGERRKTARRFLAGSPLFLAALAAGYVPWLPVLRIAAGRVPPSPPPELTVQRLGVLAAFFSFASREGEPPGLAGVIFAAIVVAGIVVAIRRRGLRFLAAALVAGGAAIEILEHVHPNFPDARHFLPAGLFAPAAAALAVSSVRRWNLLGLGVTAFLVAGVVASDTVGLSGYFRHGRADWRPLAAFLRSKPERDPIVAENQYAQLCLAYYVDGPYWLHPRSLADRKRAILVASGGRIEPSPDDTWLVLTVSGARSPGLERRAAPYPGTRFPSAEQAEVKRIPSPRRAPASPSPR